MRGAAGLKVGGGGGESEKGQRYLERKTRKDVKGHFQLGCRTDDDALSQGFVTRNKDKKRQSVLRGSARR